MLDPASFLVIEHPLAATVQIMDPDLVPVTVILIADPLAVIHVLLIRIRMYLLQEVGNIVSPV